MSLPQIPMEFSGHVPFHYITMSRRSKKYVKLFLIWILVFHRTVWHQFCKSLTISQHLTPVELKIAKKWDFWPFLTIIRELDVLDMSNYTFFECPEEYISKFDPMWPYGGRNSCLSDLIFCHQRWNGTSYLEVRGNLNHQKLTGFGLPPHYIY